MEESPPKLRGSDFVLIFSLIADAFRTTLVSRLVFAADEVKFFSQFLERRHFDFVKRLA